MDNKGILMSILILFALSACNTSARKEITADTTKVQADSLNERQQNFKTMVLNKPTIVIIEYDSVQLEKLKKKEGEEDFYTGMDDWGFYNSQLFEKADSLKIPVIVETANAVEIIAPHKTYRISKDTLENVNTYVYFDGSNLGTKDLFKLIDELH